METDIWVERAIAPAAEETAEPPTISPGDRIYLHGAHLRWVVVTVRAIEPGALLVDVAGVRHRVVLDPEASPRRVTGSDIPVVEIVSAEIATPPRRRRR
jgi:hypothetical protein